MRYIGFNSVKIAQCLKLNNYPKGSLLKLAYRRNEYVRGEKKVTLNAVDYKGYHTNFVLEVAIIDAFANALRLLRWSRE